MPLYIPPELTAGEKLSYREIERLVVKYGFGTNPYNNGTYQYDVSHGVKYALTNEAITQEEVDNALERFFHGDFGNMYDSDETPITGREYGCYPSSYGTEPWEGAIMVHRHLWCGFTRVTVYFQFER